MLINGKEMNFHDSITVLDLLKELDLNEDKVVIEVNLEILPKSQYSNKILNKDDRIEIISLVGGG